MYIFFRMKHIIIYVIIFSKGLQIKINIFSMLSPHAYIYIYTWSSVHLLLNHLTTPPSHDTYIIHFIITRPQILLTDYLLDNADTRTTVPLPAVVRRGQLLTSRHGGLFLHRTVQASSGRQLIGNRSGLAGLLSVS